MRKDKTSEHFSVRLQAGRLNSGQLLVTKDAVLADLCGMRRWRRLWCALGAPLVVTPL